MAIPFQVYINNTFIYEYSLCVHMASMNISIKKDAYEFLKKMKSNDQSFSDVILSFKKKNNIMDFFGALKESDWHEKEKNMKEFRESFNKRLK